MKHTYNIGRLVQGDVNEITKDEIRVVTQPDGTIDLQKRDANGDFYSTVKGGNVANIEMPYYTFETAGNGKFKGRVEGLLNMATEDGAEVSGQLYYMVEDIRSYLPDAKDIMYVHPNIIGYIGCKTDDGGFELANLDWYLKAEVTNVESEEDRTITLIKFDSTVE